MVRERKDGRVFYDGRASERTIIETSVIFFSSAVVTLPSSDGFFIGEEKMVYENVPGELKALRQWVNWKWSFSVKEHDHEAIDVEDNGREYHYFEPTYQPSKMPVTASGAAASSSDPATWNAFDVVASVSDYKFKADPGTFYTQTGVGFVFSAGDPYCGIDLDDSLRPDGTLHPWAQKVYDAFGSYTEVSPSGTGVKIWVRATLPGTGRRWKWEGGEIEVYDRARFFTVTGERYGDHAEVTDGQAQVDKLLSAMTRKPKKRDERRAHAVVGTVSLTDQDIVDKASNAKNGWKFRQLWAGDTSAYGDNDSNADQALCNILAFWTGRDPDRIDALFRWSGLFRDKWDRVDYRDRTIRNAIASCDEVYAPRSPTDDFEWTKDDEKKVSLPPKQGMGTLNIMSATNFLNDDTIHEAAPVIDGLLRRREIANIISGPKMRKSWGMLDLALSVASGTKWLDDIQCSQGRVLLIDNELPRGELQKRLQTMCDARGINSEALDALDIVSLRGRNFDIHALLEALDAAPAGYSLIVIDALYRIFPEGFDENDNAKWTWLFNHLDALAERTESAIICVHHTSKGSQEGKATTDVGSGAGAQSRAADAHLVLRATKTGLEAQDEAPRLAYLTAVVRSWRPFERRELKWEFPRWTVEHSHATKNGAPEKANNDTQKFVDTCLTDHWQSKIIVESNADTAKYSRREAEKHIAFAIQKGLAEETTTNRKKMYRRAEKPF